MTNISSGEKEKKPLKLPKLRKGITLAFNDYDKDGKPQWLIHDSGRNKFFIIGWPEFELLERWSIGDGDALVEEVNQATTLHVELEDVENLIRFLENNYLIHQTGYQIFKRATEQKLFKKDNILTWIIDYYLFFKVPLCHPDAFLTRTKRIGEIVFSRGVLYVMCVLGFIALYQLSMRWEQFLHTFPTIFTWQGLFFYFIAYMVCKLFHELGHAYMCKHYGIPVPSLGVAFLVFWPVLYTDTTLSWSLNSHQRLRIALGGIWIETYITIIAALLWCNIDNTTIKSICYLTITINWLASVLINVSPFMRFDGYYVLADYMKMPNLQPRAFALTRWQIRRWLFNWPDPPPEHFSPSLHRFLVAYSIVTWIYRLSIYFGIALLVYHFFIKVVGIILFAIEVYYFILGPFVNEIQTWIYFKSKFTFNRHTQITLFFAILGVFLFLLPVNETVKLPATLSHAHSFLIAPAEGQLQTPLPAKGTLVKANEPIIQIKSNELNNDLLQIKLEYDKKLSELRRASINSAFEKQKGVLASDLIKEQAKYAKLYELRRKLNVSVPFNGVVADTVSDLRQGNFVRQDEWLGDVIDPSKVVGEAFVSQIDVNDLNVGMTGHFYPHDLSEPTIPVKITSIEIINSNKLDCQYSSEVQQNKNSEAVVESPCLNASELGGDIATYLTDTGDYVPVDSVFRVTLSVEKPTTLNHIQRGTVVIKTKPNSFISRFYYQLKTVWIKQSGF